MLRSQAVRGIAAVLLLALAVAPAGIAVATSPQDAQTNPDKSRTPEERMNRRYPQPVRVGFVIGLPMLDDRDSTYGYIRDVVRTPENKIALVVPYRDWLGWAPTVSFEALVALLVDAAQEREGA